MDIVGYFLSLGLRLNVHDRVSSVLFKYLIIILTASLHDCLVDTKCIS